MKERLLVDAQLPMLTSEPTRWIADEDVFRHPYPYVKTNCLSVIAKCLSAGWQHEFVFWTLSPKDRDEVLAIVQTEYEAICVQPGAVNLFDFPFPGVTYPDWSQRPVLPPVMTKERHQWLQSLSQGQTVGLVVYVSSQTQPHVFNAILEGADDTQFIVGKAALPLLRQDGYHRFKQDETLFEYWLLPSETNHPTEQLVWSEAITKLPLPVPPPPT